MTPYIYPNAKGQVAGGDVEIMQAILREAAAVFYVAEKLNLVVTALPYLISAAPVHMMFGKKIVSEDDVRQLDAAAQRFQAKAFSSEHVGPMAWSSG